MATIENITHHVFSSKQSFSLPYTSPTYGEEAFDDIPNYQWLNQYINYQLVEEVIDYVKDEKSLLYFREIINQENALDYLIACKMADMRMEGNPAIINSTYAIREICLLVTKDLPIGEEINALAAFTKIPIHAPIERITSLKLNHLDKEVQQADKELKDRLLESIHDFSQTKAEFIPEFIPLLEQLIRDRIYAMVAIANALPANTHVIYKGPSFSGKTFAMKSDWESKIRMPIHQAVLAINSLHEDLRSRELTLLNGKVIRIQDICSNQQSFLLVVSIAKVVDRIWKTHKTFMRFPTLKEDWFHSQHDIERLFELVRNNDRKLQIHDFDGDFLILCCRALSRSSQSNVPLSQIERGFLLTRKNRPLLLQRLRKDKDIYTYQYSFEDGRIVKIDPQILYNPTDYNPEVIEQEVMEEINQKKAFVITKAIAERYEIEPELIGFPIGLAFLYKQAPHKPVDEEMTRAFGLPVALIGKSAEQVISEAQ